MRNTIISTRMRLYSYFRGITISRLYKAWRYLRNLQQEDVHPNCGCGCGGDRIDNKLYTLGVEVSQDVFSSGSQNS